MSAKSMDEARKRNALAGECIGRGDFREALEHLSGALDHLPDDERGPKARLLSNTGHVNVKLGQLDDARKGFEDAADVFRELGDDVGLGEQLGNLGSVYRDMEAWDEALPCYRQALEIFERIEHKAGIAAQYSNISYACSGKGELQEALDYALKARGLFEESGDTRRAELSRKNILALKAALGIE